MTDFFLEQWMYSENVCTVAPAVADKKEYETIHQICYCVRSYATLPLGFILDEIFNARLISEIGVNCLS